MIPFYRSKDSAVILYNEAWEDVLAAGLIPLDQVTLVHADGPYGIGLKTGGRGAGRTFGKGTAPLKQRSYPPIRGDEKPFDPAPLLALDRPLVTWGANYYCDKLPPSPSWLWWDKREHHGSDNGADGEMAWTNLGGPARSFHHLWKGTCRASEAGPNHPHLHPTQKPVALCTFVFKRAKLRPGNLVLVPYGGSCPEIVAARSMGLRVIICETEREYCERSVRARILDAEPLLEMTR